MSFAMRHPAHSPVIPANAGTHNHRMPCDGRCRPPCLIERFRGMGPRFSRLCEKSVVQFACRTSVSVSCIWKTNSTGNLGQEMAIEKTILRFLGSRDFSHSMVRGDDELMV